MEWKQYPLLKFYSSDAMKLSVMLSAPLTSDRRVDRGWVNQRKKFLDSQNRKETIERLH